MSRLIGQQGSTRRDDPSDEGSNVDVSVPLAEVVSKVEDAVGKIKATVDTITEVRITSHEFRVAHELLTLI